MKGLTLRAIVLLTALILGATACSGGGSSSVFDLSVGDCFTSPEADEISSVDVVDCGSPHDHEVYLLFDLDDDDFPGSAAVSRLASDTCLGSFDEYVGTEYTESALAIGFLPPSESTWDSGDREVVCYLFDANGAKLISTAKGSGL